MMPMTVQSSVLRKLSVEWWISQLKSFDFLSCSASSNKIMCRNMKWQIELSAIVVRVVKRNQNLVFYRYSVRNGTFGNLFSNYFKVMNALESRSLECSHNAVNSKFHFWLLQVPQFTLNESIWVSIHQWAHNLRIHWRRSVINSCLCVFHFQIDKQRVIHDVNKRNRMHSLDML